MDAVERLLDDLRDKAGVPAFICYGTLLGAIRNGRLIGHDNDVDLAYVSEHPTPWTSSARPTASSARCRTPAGWCVVVPAAHQRAAQAERRLLALHRRLHRELGRGHPLHPLGHRVRAPPGDRAPPAARQLHGRSLPGPADPERLLAATYGDGWRVPDPSFKYETPRWLSRRFGGWFGGLKTRRKHWDAFYVEACAEVPGRAVAVRPVGGGELPVRPAAGGPRVRGPGATRCGSPPRWAPGHRARLLGARDPRPAGSPSADSCRRRSGASTSTTARGPRHRGAAEPDGAAGRPLRAVHPARHGRGRTRATSSGWPRWRCAAAGCCSSSSAPPRTAAARTSSATTAATSGPADVVARSRRPAARRARGGHGAARVRARTRRVPHRRELVSGRWGV